MAALKINAGWHAKQRMPAKATLKQRIAWHIAHAEHCGCRPIPAKLVSQIRRHPS